jgi:hypothetical protein
VKSELKYLLHPLPVMLDPVWPRSLPEPEPWSLPSRVDSRTLLTFHGTAAIYQAIRCLGLTEGQKVLIPSYNCGHELEPVLRAGAAVGFYRINERLEIDLDDLEAAVDKDTRAVLVTLEDCAHALFSCDGSQPDGLTGDLAVYSLRKTLPIPHGGALVCHDSLRPLPDALAPPPTLSLWHKSLERYQKSLLLPRTGVPWPLRRTAFLGMRLGVDAARAFAAASRVFGLLQWDPEDESIEYPADVLSWGVDASVEQRLHQFRASPIVKARRRNFKHLLSVADSFSGCRPLFDCLPDGVCPLYFPVLSDDPERLLGRLRDGAVSAVRWWCEFHAVTPWERYPKAVWLKRSLVALPIHQDLEVQHIETIILLLTQRS